MWLQFSSDGRWLGVAWHGEQAQLLEVSTTREYRTLVSSLGAGQGAHHVDSDISPDGRLLALGMSDAVRLWDLPSGRELAVLPARLDRVLPGRLANCSSPVLTMDCSAGRSSAGAAANELFVGPPRPTVATLPLVPSLHAARSPDGRTLAIVQRSGGTSGCSWTWPPMRCGRRWASTRSGPAMSP